MLVAIIDQFTFSFFRIEIKYILRDDLAKVRTIKDLLNSISPFAKYLKKTKDCMSEIKGQTGSNLPVANFVPGVKQNDTDIQNKGSCTGAFLDLLYNFDCSLDSIFGLDFRTQFDRMLAHRLICNSYVNSFGKTLSS
jgi:hypothetical protein